MAKVKFWLKEKRRSMGKNSHPPSGTQEPRYMLETRSTRVDKSIKKPVPRRFLENRTIWAIWWEGPLIHNKTAVNQVFARYRRALETILIESATDEFLLGVAVWVLLSYSEFAAASRPANWPKNWDFSQPVINTPRWNSDVNNQLPKYKITHLNRQIDVRWLTI